MAQFDYHSGSIYYKFYYNIFIIICLLCVNLNAWMPDITPKLMNLKHEQGPAFFGNSTDYFKILHMDENSILIGARNAVYNLSLNGLRENDKQRIEWSSSDADRELCALKGKLEHDCQNYIRVFARITDGKILLCGTNSYKPRCRYYSNIQQQNLINNNNNNNSLNNNNSNNNNDDKQYEIVNEIEAQGRCPYSPIHNSTYLYTDGQLYSATVADFSGADPLIYREPQRTEQYDLKHLNQPAFVNAVERNGYVFFFFREIAMEYMNCGKAIYSRVGRVCKNDKGGPYGFNDRWTSYLKTRLNCSVPGEYPFYFDEIQSTSEIIDGIYNGNHTSIIYAIFTTSMNAIPGSAICAFTINDILQVFEGRFKFQKDINSNWLPLPTDNVPEPRPGRCVDDSRSLSSATMNFIKTHTLMENSVPPMYGKPLLTRVTSQHRLTAITVDPQIQAIDGNYYDVIFAGSDDGKVIKFINISPSSLNHNQGSSSQTDDYNMETVIISEIQALPQGMPIRELRISHKNDQLIVVGDGHIISIPLYHCSKINYCYKCLSIQDPYCVWDISNHECKPIRSLIKYSTVTSTSSGTTTTTTTTSSSSSIAATFIQTIQNVTKQNIIQLCKEIGDNGNRIDSHRPIAMQTGILKAIGKSVHQSSTTYRENKSIQDFTDTNDLTNTINVIVLPDPLVREELAAAAASESQNSEEIRLASNNFYWSFAIIVLLIVFGVGIIVGLCASKKLCRTSPFHAEHRNQLSPKSRPLHHSRNSGKDVNLLMNTNPFPPTTPINNKKDNLEHEFVVNEKDRSHECKNSTENLEKEVHCKTGTLTKVKRTYI